MAARSLLLTFLAVLLHGWSCAQTIILQLSAIPANATRVVSVVDQGTLAAPLRFTKDVTAGAGTANMTLGVPAGGPYRIRAIAFTAGLAYPAILRSGKTTGVFVPSTTTVTGQITLAAINATLDASTPSSAMAGSTATLMAGVTDPGDTAFGASASRVYYLTTPLGGNQLGNDRAGPIERLAEGNYRLSASMAAPQAGATLYYQFAFNAWDFNDANHVEQPYFFWPNVSAGAAPLTLSSQGSSTLSVSVTGLPAAGNRLVAVVDGAGLQQSVRIVKDYTVGASSTTLTINVPAGSPYRIRVIAFTAGSLYPAVLRSGKATGLTAPASPTIVLTDPVFTPLASTPASAPSGTSLSLEGTLTDAGDALEGMPVSRVYSRTTAFTSNLDGAESRGILEGLGYGSFRFSVPLALPSYAATAYYQFAANAYDFNDPSGLELPQYCWPNLQGGQALRHVAATLLSSIRVTFSGVPSSATRLIAVVDQGGLTTPVRAAATFTAGQPPANITVGVPAASAYRVRLIAVKSGQATPVILRSGKTSGITVASGATASASITLSDYNVALDAATPTTGTAGTIVNVIATVTDPGETASGANVARLYSAASAFTQNLAAAVAIGSLETNTGGTLKLTAPVILPGSGGILYYQLAYEALDFTDSAANERPFFCWPNLEASQALKQITSNANPNLLSISGKVTLNSVPLSGVTMTLSGYRAGSMVTTTDGTYAFSSLPAANYTVTPTRTNYSFTPASSPVALATNRTVDFTAAQVMGTIALTVSNLPPTANRIVAIVEGAALTTPMRVVQNFTPGQSSAAMNISVPVASDYRIRVIAFTAGTAKPAILLAGQAAAVAAPSSLTLGLADPTFTPLAGTPVSEHAGSDVTLELDLADPGDALSGVAAGSLFSQQQPFTANATGTESRGPLQFAAPGSYRLSVVLSLPSTEVTTHYQFAANAFDFNDPGGSESPHYFWPDPQSGQPAAQIASTFITAVRIGITGVPATATRLVILVDQGALSHSVRTVLNFTAGQPPVTTTVGVPAGGTYRVRIIAIRSGSATPVILRAGKATGVYLQTDTTADAAVTLADPVVSPDSANPTSGLAGTTVTLTTNMTDPGDTAAGTTSSTAFGATTQFTQNLTATASTGLLEKTGNGVLKLTSPITLPANGATYYYQVAFAATDFSDPGGTELPFFCWPNLEAGQSLKQLTIIPAYTISGKVTYAGVALSGVTVSLSGLRTASMTTAADGAYAFSGLPAGGYTVTATRNNFTFSPASSTVTIAANRTLNFAVAQVTGSIGVSRSVLRFGATLGGSAATTTQEIGVDISDNLPVSWTVTSDKTWLRATPSLGTGSGSFTVSLNMAALPATGIWSGKLTLTTSTSTSAQIVIQVYLAVSPSTGAPFGTFETPASGPTELSSSVPVTGWALDDVGVKKVQIWRDPVNREPVHPNGLVYIGDAIFVPDARPDVAALYFDKPNNYRAGWGYMMLTNFLPNPTGGPPGNGTYRIHAVAVDEEGRQTELGVKTITVNNVKATKPFGTIDLPQPGEVVSGTSFGVTGWALTPQPYKVDESGAGVRLLIDGVMLGSATYNIYRSDVANLFPTYANAGGSAAAYSLDTTRLGNGMHNIAWVVTDSAGRTDGLGSRYFFVRNTAPVAAQLPLPVAAVSALDVTSTGDIEIEELGRVELQLPRGAPWRGRIAYNDDRMPLPAGSTLDPEAGVFVWQLGPGFVGEYYLEFGNANETRTIRVLVRPFGSAGDLAKKR